MEAKKKPSVKISKRAKEAISKSGDKRHKFNAEKFAEAIDGSLGIKSVISRRLGVSRIAVNQWLNDYPEFKKQLEAEQESVLDLAESKHYEKINEGHWPSIKFHLSTKGRARGYEQ